jgi:hypothetical protein
MVSDSTIHAFLGAVATVLLGFVPFSPVLGGAVAAYLDETEDGLRIGAISGLIASIPLVFFLLVVLTLGAAVLGFGGPARGPFLGGALFLLFGVLFVGAYTVGLSAIGGYLGAYLVGETDGRNGETV